MRDLIDLIENEDLSPVQAFMKDYIAMTGDNPFNHRVRMHGGAGIELSPWGDGIHISDVAAYEKRKGHGKAAMEMICKLADKHGVELELTAKAYTKDGMTTAELKRWYVSFGFVWDVPEYEDDDVSDEGYEDDGFNMIRRPKKVIKLGTSSRRIDTTK